MHDYDDERPPLAPGEKVRVFRSHSANPISLRDPATGEYVTYSPNEFEAGVVKQQLASIYYRVTITWQGRELDYDTGRYWIRRIDEYAPGAHA